MAFTPSAPPDITEGIPTPLTRAQEASQVFTQQNIEFDVAIAGLPFIMAENDQRPYQRETAPFQKEQIDTTREAGEQTLDGYWIRSQTTWDKGAGVRFFEPSLDENSVDRFENSLGVNVWGRGKITLLRSMASTQTVTSGQTAFVTGGVVSGSNVLFTNTNGTIKRESTSYTGVTDALTAVCLAGSKILVGRATSIAVGDATGTSLTDLWTGASSAPTPYWVKSRIIATESNSLWELTLTGGTWPTDALHEHPDAGWKWTDVTEGPNAIYAAGYSNGLSSIYAFALQDASTGTVPELGQAYQVLELPLGEEIHSIHVALGSFMGIGTSKGVRVAIIQSDGTLAAGPLLFMTDRPVKALASGDRFIYGVVENGQPDGKTGAFRVDLSQTVGNPSDLRFPYAWDARTGVTGAPSSVALYGASDRVAIAITGSGVYLQSDSTYESSGWITTGRIRYGTVVPKNFRLLSVTESSGNGEMVVYAVDANDAEVYLRTLSEGADGTHISLDYLGTRESYRFKLELRPVADLTPVVESLQVRALPSPIRQRLIQFPLLCMDYIQTAGGVKIGTEGAARTMLKALEYAEENNIVVTVQDFLMDETYQAEIERVTFIRPGPRSTDKRANFGGYVLVTVRKL